MCLSGVDYFSTLGYQPGIAVLAAGALAPIATLILVVVTLAGVVPVYRAVARHSPHGLGSISMMEKLVSGWKGKFVVLVLLGFAMTDFIITMTLSAADAAAHMLGRSDSPWQLWATLGLLAALAAVFLRGFREAVAVAVVLVSTYLALTIIVLADASRRLFAHPELFGTWRDHLHAQSANPWMLLLLAMIVFPKLALGLSGFEAGVSVMPLVRAQDVPERITRSKKLLATSAVLMSSLLIVSSFAVTLLVPAEELAHGGHANGRALAWLAETNLGPVFGNIYDWSTVSILWFAGASAMSGLLALIPRYLPRYGMAPSWAQRSRPMVLVLTGIGFLVTVIFRADVDAQAGAYATGVLVILAAGGVAVTVLCSGRRRILFAATTVVLLITLVVNVVERPDGLHVAGWFIAGIIGASLASRVWRSFELREVGVSLDDTALRIIQSNTFGPDIALVPWACRGDIEEKERRIRQRNSLDDEPMIFIEVTLRDPSRYSEPLEIHGASRNGVPVLSVASGSIANAVAIIALEVEKLTGRVPDVYYEWSPGNPLKEMLRFIFLGDGQNATVTREMLRRAIANEEKRPRIHLC